MKWQHCGKLGEHPPHRFWARPRRKVLHCVCDNLVCVCPEIAGDDVRMRQRFSCPGVLQVEGAPAHMPTEVNLDKGSELCGLQGSSAEGYCVCTQPAGHWPDQPHACKHGGWF